MEKNIEKRFQSARHLFPVTARDCGVTYFNSASTGPLCRPVRRVLDDYYDLCEVLIFDDDKYAFEELEYIRRIGARMIGAREDEVGFGFNTGYGLNLAAFGLPLKKGDEVILSDIEFPANVYPWLALKERGIKIKFVKSDGGLFSIENLIKSITKRSRVLSLSFVQFFNGYKNDLETIGAICRERGLYFVVDGIQGCGVEPIDVRKWQVDIFSSGAQKWLLAPLGTGIFYIRKDLQEKLNRPLAGWLAVDWNFDFTDLFKYNLPFFDSARGFELGTYPYSHVHALSASLKLINSLGVRNIQKHNYGLLDILISYLKSNEYFQIKSSLEKKHRSSILAFTCRDAKKLHQKLLEEKIICSYREGAIRVSVHLFNNKADIKRLITALERFSS